MRIRAQHQRHPTYSAAGARCITILWCVIAAVAGGCTSGSVKQQKYQNSFAQRSSLYDEARAQRELQPVAQTQPVRRESNDEQPRVQAVDEQASEPDGELVVDPGVQTIVQRIVTAIDGSVDSQITIGVWNLENVSRCRREEFQQLQERIAILFTAAGAESDLHFTSDSSAEVDYHLQGSAYLMTADGFDQWEVFLRLRPVDQTWAQWDAPGPVRILRHARPNQPQVLLSAQW